MSKEQKRRIQDVEETLRNAVNRGADLARQNTALWAENVSLKDVAFLVNEELGECYVQIGELQKSLDECQAGREIERSSVEHWKMMHGLTNEKRKKAIELLNTADYKLEEAGRSLKYHEIKAENHAKWYEELLQENKTLEVENGELAKYREANYLLWREMVAANEEIDELRAQLDTINDCTVDFITAFQPLVSTLLEYDELDTEQAAKTAVNTRK